LYLHSLLVSSGSRATSLLVLIQDRSVQYNAGYCLQQAFKLAKKLYDLRSMIAHGNSKIPENIDLCGEMLSLNQVASRACEVLRSVISRILPTAISRSYCAFDFWEKQYFGL
jgi:hypothetical protein